MKYNSSVFPIQKLPINKKDDDWRKNCVDYVIGMGETSPSSSDGSTFDEMQSNYNLYNGIFNMDDLKYVTNPFNQEDGFPASPQGLNLIKQKIDLLIGEESKSPQNIKVIRTSQEATSELQEKMKKMLTEYMLGELMASMGEEEAAEFQSKLDSGEILPPEAISKMMSEGHKDVAERTAFHTLEYLKRKLGTQHEFLKGWKDALISGKEIYYAGIVNGEPHLERVNPLYFSHDMAPDLEFIEDGDWASKKMQLSYTEVYDRLNDKMDENDLDELLKIAGQDPGSSKYGKQTGSAIDANMSVKFINSKNSDAVNTANVINLWHVVWKSQRKVGFVVIQDETGQVQTITVSEDYMPIGNEISIEWKWITEVWEGYRAGDNLYVGISPMQYQYVSMDNMNAQKLPYTGVIYNNTNTASKSLVSILKPIQYLYIITWYRLELAMARDKGKVINMDMTQIPKSMNIDPAKWMHYLSAIGVNFINPYEEGWDIPGREGGKPASFNQITELDLTMSSVIDQYVNLLSKIEDMAGDVSGISSQREGAISSRELVGSVERSVVQSSLVTEPLFWMHSRCKENALKTLLNTAKEAWRLSGRKNIQYIMNDASRAFMDITDPFLYEDMDVFLSDATADQKNIEMLKSLYQPAMQNGATLADIAEIMILDNVSEIKAKLRSIEELRAQQNEQAAESENQRQAELIQLQNQQAEIEMAFRQQELELDRYKVDSDNTTKIHVAELNAYRNMADSDSDQDGVPDVMEIADLALKTNQFESDKFVKAQELNAKRMAEISKANIEKKKIDSSEKLERSKFKIEEDKLKFEKEKLVHAERLQKIKDKAAMEREQLKAKTAIRNKVAGQK